MGRSVWAGILRTTQVAALAMPRCWTAWYGTLPGRSQHTKRRRPLERRGQPVASAPLSSRGLRTRRDGLRPGPRTVGRPHLTILRGPEVRVTWGSRRRAGAFVLNRVVEGALESRWGTRCFALGGHGLCQGERDPITRNGTTWNKCEAEAKHRVRKPKSERAKVRGRKIIALALSWW